MLQETNRYNKTGQTSQYCENEPIEHRRNADYQRIGEIALPSGECVDLERVDYEAFVTVFHVSPHTNTSSIQLPDSPSVTDIHKSRWYVSFGWNKQTNQPTDWCVRKEHAANPLIQEITDISCIFPVIILKSFEQRPYGVQAPRSEQT